MKKIVAVLILAPSFSIAATIYTSDGLSYEGMSQAAVQAMLDAQGSKATLVSKTAFDQDTIDRINRKPPPSVDTVKQQAILDAKNDSLDAKARLNALIKAIDLK